MTRDWVLESERDENPVVDVIVEVALFDEFLFKEAFQKPIIRGVFEFEFPAVFHVDLELFRYTLT